MQKRSWIFFGVSLFLLLALREVSLLPDGKLHIRALSVGQGDAIMIALPEGEQIIVDGGHNWKSLEKLGKHMSFFDRTIELLILSHGDADHITSLVELPKKYTVEAALLTGFENSARSRALASALQKQGTKIIAAHAGKHLQIGSVDIQILWPPKVLPKSLGKKSNNTSVVARLEYNGRRLLLTGDIEKTVEETLVRTSADLRADILKVAHHGSKSSSIQEFLDQVDPEIAIISAGKQNRFGHPHEEVAERLEAKHIEILRTDAGEDVEVVW